MNVGGRRQLPSWMVRTTATEHSTDSEIKVQNKENDSVKLDTIEPVKKKVRAKKHENGAPLNEKELQMLKKCDARNRKRKSNKYEEGQAEENELCLLKPCEVSSNKKHLASQPKHVEDRVDDFFEKDLDKKEDGLVRKRARNNAPRKKSSEKLKGTFDDVMVESGSSDDELTVEDLVSIAEEYVKAERTDSQKSNLEQDVISLHKSDTQSNSGKHLTTHRENGLVNDQPLSFDSSLAKHSINEGHVTDLSTSDITRTMIDLFLGPNFRKKLEEVDRKTD